MSASAAKRDAALLELAQSLPSTDLEIQTGKLLLKDVIETLKKQKTYFVARVCIVGSTGKYPAWKDNDFDCILFINFKVIQPPFETVLEFLDSTLEPYRAELKMSKPRRTGFSLQFNLDGKYQVDLLMASNNTSKVKPPNCGTFHGHEIDNLKSLAENPDKYFDYNSSNLAKYQNRFINDINIQNSLSHNLVPLCKLWLKKLDMKDYRSGVKAYIELLAMYTTYERRDNSITNTFKDFLKNVKQMDELKMVFHLCSDEYWVDSFPYNLGHNLRDDTVDYCIHDVFTGDVSTEIAPDRCSKLKEYAETTLHNLDSWASYPNFDIFLQICAEELDN